MSSSSSKIPGIILGVIVVAILVAFYIADRSSDGMSGTDHSGGKNDDSYHHSSGEHSGYSGPLKEYLKKH